jgi:hypothetical protein
MRGLLRFAGIPRSRRLRTPLEFSEVETGSQQYGYRPLVRFGRQRHSWIITAHECKRLDAGFTQALIGMENYIAHCDRTWNQSEVDNR